MYSQYQEEEYILKYFRGRTGRFLDIGACDGATFSNTLALAKAGWMGTLVEPSDHNFRLLCWNYSYLPSIPRNLVNAAILTRPGTFRESVVDPVHNRACRLLGGTEDAHIAKWSGSGVEFEPTPIEAMDPATLIERFPGPYEFVSIDTEGTSVEILKALPLADMRTELVCVEHDSAYRDVMNFLATRWGLTRTIYQNNCNILIGR